MTQTARLIAYLDSHPGASSAEIQAALHLTNATGRMSDVRRAGLEQGFSVLKERRFDSNWGYRLVYLHPVQRELGLGAA